MSAELVMAPWTPEQVDALNAWQASSYVHPFTCGDRGDGRHRDTGLSTGALVATSDGWVCRDCSYTQGWAHGFMTRLVDRPSWAAGAAPSEPGGES